MGEETDTARTSVRTYLPEYQKAEWEEHAEELGMSRSEFVRAMVQAGRRGFLDNGSPSTDPRGNGPETDSDGSELEPAVVDVLRDEGPLGWESLLAELTDDVEERLDETLQDLQEADRIRYSGRDGGYTLVDDER
jgi:hypothetical protein